MMNLVRWEPSRDNLWMDRVFEGLLPSRFWWAGAEQESSWMPRTDVIEEKDAFRIEVDLPGVRKDSIRISVQDNRLEVVGERKSETAGSAEGYQRLERAQGSFRRAFRLPKGTDAGKIESIFENGVLTVRVPKAEEAIPRQIEVKVR
jgi:HSP20 family protein